MGRCHKRYTFPVSYYILADCNNFYVSCERLLNPKLENKPVVILSNNDGCVISRSQEAKDLGIKMGDPYFKIKNFCKQANISAFSSNYKLYGDISRRIMNVYSEMAPEIEVYSIDEAFLKYSSANSSDIGSICQHLRKMIKRWVGIPISLGVGPTKTLSKVANSLAKKNKNGFFDLSSEQIRSEIFMNYPIGDVWGIGSRLTERLKNVDIHTIADFVAKDPLFIRNKMGVIGERMHLELRGIPCLELEEDVASKKSITCSRSFGKLLNKESEIAEALSTFAARGCVKLRAQNSFAKAIYIFVETSSTVGGVFQRFQFNSHAVFEKPTNDTSEIITAAKKCLKRLFQSDKQYRKCGIIFSDLISEEDIVPDFFVKPMSPQRKAILKTVDDLNKKFGKNKLFFGAMGVDPQWKMRSDFLSSHNTTSWDHLPKVIA